MRRFCMNNIKKSQTNANNQHQSAILIAGTKVIYTWIDEFFLSLFAVRNRIVMECFEVRTLNVHGHTVDIEQAKICFFTNSNVSAAD